MGDDCKLCGGIGEVEITSKVDWRSDYFPCPFCVAEELKAQAPTTVQSQFDMAVLLFGVAVELNDAKRIFSPCHRDHAAAIVLEMHKLAEALAGERAKELYGESEK